MDINSVTKNDYEDWKPIPNYPNYYCSSYGRIKNARNNYILKPIYQKRSGRLHTKLGGEWQGEISRLVLLTFVGPPPEIYFEACHEDGNPQNNHLDNLRWDTHSNNILDSVKHGTQRSVRKTHCPYGHKLESPNLRPNRAGRICLACHRASAYCTTRTKKNIETDFQSISDMYYERIVNAA